MILRDWACECGQSRCRERIYLAPKVWRSAATYGFVVTPEHIWPTAKIVKRGLGYVVVESARG